MLTIISFRWKICMQGGKSLSNTWTSECIIYLQKLMRVCGFIYEYVLYYRSIYHDFIIKELINQSRSLHILRTQSKVDCIKKDPLLWAQMETERGAFCRSRWAWKHFLLWLAIRVSGYARRVIHCAWLVRLHKETEQFVLILASDRLVYD